MKSPVFPHSRRRASHFHPTPLRHTSQNPEIGNTQ
uniref:Uncharacterized protein n=1 Tax=Phage sp. ct4bw6 TaxID=2826747 RepID=A0A8S5MVP0_9VIRU|nr:MAG TPA: hypothetical protein [Phage sp. ct4bw6]